ncbi:MAG: hypothetical protein QM674_18430 [Burkholderiaceae bacterium]
MIVVRRTPASRRPRRFAVGRALACALAAGGLAVGHGIAHSAVPKPSAALTKEVTEACIKASDLHKARAAGKPIEFDDQIGMTALLIEGEVMLSRTKSRKGRVLCLFDKVTRNAFVGDATGLITNRR